MPDNVSDVARRLADSAEAVCRYYLSNGRRQGRYWIAGDVRNTPGRSLFVRLSGPGEGRGAAGKWSDAATGEHGDLLDLIQASLQLRDVRNAVDEARRFLGISRPVPVAGKPPPAGSPEAARRLFAMSQPIPGTLAEVYLRGRGIRHWHSAASLRFHPNCFYLPDEAESRTGRRTWPALVAAVTDLAGNVTGVQRTWLDLDGRGKAPVAVPRRAMGQLLGHAVRFGGAGDIMVAGEGIETILSLHGILPTLPKAAALSAGHLASLQVPSEVRRFYIAQDTDRAGEWAVDQLSARMSQVGIEAIVLSPQLGDFNDDLQRTGLFALAARLRVQLAPEDVARFWRPSD